MRKNYPTPPRVSDYLSTPPKERKVISTLHKKSFSVPKSFTIRSYTAKASVLGASLNNANFASEKSLSRKKSLPVNKILRSESTRKAVR